MIEHAHADRECILKALLCLIEQKMTTEVSHFEKLLVPERNNKIFGLHGFSRCLYRDVPDAFDELKKMLTQIQSSLNRLNPEVANS